jgi:hypothetical protein
MMNHFTLRLSAISSLKRGRFGQTKTSRHALVALGRLLSYIGRPSDCCAVFVFELKDYCHEDCICIQWTSALHSWILSAGKNDFGVMNASVALHIAALEKGLECQCRKYCV